MPELSEVETGNLPAKAFTVMTVKDSGEEWMHSAKFLTKNQRTKKTRDEERNN